MLIDGSHAVYLEGRFQSVVMASRNSDGTVSHDCVDHIKAEAFLKANIESQAKPNKADAKPTKKVSSQDVK